MLLNSLYHKYYLGPTLSEVPDGITYHLEHLHAYLTSVRDPVQRLFRIHDLLQRFKDISHLYLSAETLEICFVRIFQVVGAEFICFLSYLLTICVRKLLKLYLIMFYLRLIIIIICFDVQS